MHFLLQGGQLIFYFRDGSVSFYCREGSVFLLQRWQRIFYCRHGSLFVHKVLPGCTVNIHKGDKKMTCPAALHHSGTAFIK